MANKPRNPKEAKTIADHGWLVVGYPCIRTQVHSTTTLRSNEEDSTGRGKIQLRYREDAGLLVEGRL